jgi:arginyl-tRNA synthetase
MDSIKAKMANVVTNYLNGEGASLDGWQPLQSADVVQLWERPPQSEMGDYAMPCFRFAKALRKSPPAVAHDLAKHLTSSLSADIEGAQAQGAFLNVFVNFADLAAQGLPFAFEQRMKAAALPQGFYRKVMVEYSQPNTHKEFHIGHARNVCLGDSLVRMMKFCGFEVTPVNYIGDEGTHIAKCLFQLERDGLEVGKMPADVAALGKAYAKADTYLAEANPQDVEAAKQKISEILSGIEAKKGTYFESWKATREWSMKDFRRIYGILHAEFTHYFFESELSEESQQIVDEFLAKGIFTESEGAIGIDLSEHKLGFLILRKRDGNTLYATKDLALHRRKFEKFGIEHSVVVVADEQKHHFQQVFKTLELMGFPQAKQCYHLSYGMVVRPEGKMSSRKGNSVLFDELLSQIEDGVAKVMEESKGKWSEEVFAKTVRQLALGALKYGMIQADPQHRIVFDLEAWLSFDGNTGPYLMYTYARSRSILRRAEEQGMRPVLDATLYGKLQVERDLVRGICDFSEHVLQAATHHRPSILGQYLYNLCKVFNKFYIEVPIMKDEQAQRRAARLYLLTSFAHTLHLGLGLLGMEPPEEM